MSDQLSFREIAERLRTLRPPFEKEDMARIVGLWYGYPKLVALLWDRKDHTLMQELYIAHGEAYRLLADVADSLGIWSHPIRASGHLCSEMVAKFRDRIDTGKAWPDSLASAYGDLPGFQRKTIDDGAAAILELAKRIDAKPTETPAAPAEHAPPPGPPGTIYAKLGKPLTLLQHAILKELDGKSLTKSRLAKACGLKDEGSLYATSRKHKTGGLTELMELGIVKNERCIGYYRPDAPPNE